LSISRTNDGSKDLPIILGVDPGSLLAGYAFIQAKIPHPRTPRDYRLLDAGVLKAKATLPALERIGLMHGGLFGLMEEYKPQILVMEKAFYDKNPATTIRLGEVRGAFISAAARLSIPLEGISPAEVKKLIAGNGRATKEQVSSAVKSLMGFDRGQMPFDVTDAIAIAMAHGLNMVVQQYVPSNAQRSRASEERNEIQKT
jgi:crossover junction endodeoxyribonuclease RuvC